MTLAEIFIKYGIKFDELKKKYGRDYNALQGDEEFLKYSKEYSTFVSSILSSTSKQFLDKLARYLYDEGVLIGWDQNQLGNIGKVNKPSNMFAFMNDKYFSEYLLVNQPFVNEIEEELNDGKLNVDLSLVGYESYASKIEKEYNVKRDEIKEKAARKYKDACAPKETITFYTGIINNPECDDTDKIEFSNLIDIVSNKVNLKYEENQNNINNINTNLENQNEIDVSFEDVLKSINKDPKFIEGLELAKDDSGYDFNFVYEYKDTFLQALNNEKFVNILKAKDFDDISLLAAEYSRRQQNQLYIKSDTRKELEDLVEEKQKKIDDHNSKVFDVVDESEEFLKHGIKLDESKNSPGNLRMEYEKMGKGSFVYAYEHLNFGTDIIEESKTTFNNLINKNKDKSYPEGINVYNINELVQVIANMKVNHMNRPLWQRFFGYFGKIGSELSVANNLSKQIAETLDIDQKFVDDAVNESMQKKFIIDRQLESPEQKGKEIPRNKTERNAYFKEVDKFRLDTMNIDPSKSVYSTPLDILTKKVIEKQNIVTDDMLVSNNLKSNDENIDKSYLYEKINVNKDEFGILFDDKELNTKTKQMRQQVLKEENKFDFTKKDLEEFTKIDLENQEIEGNINDFKSIDDKYSFLDEYIEGNDINAVNDNLNVEKEIDFPELNQYKSKLSRNVVPLEFEEIHLSNLNNDESVEDESIDKQSILIGNLSAIFEEKGNLTQEVKEDKKIDVPNLEK